MSEFARGLEGDGPDAVEDLRVLYVGGDEPVADRLEAADSGLTVLTERSEAAAFERLVGGTVDCVVTAHALDEGDGLSLLRAVRDRYLDVAVVLYADADGGVLSEAVAADLDGYRPESGTDPADLAAAVREAVRARAARTEPLDRMTEAFFVLDEECRFTYLNGAAGEIVRQAAATERAPGEYLGREIWTEIPDAVGTRFHEEYTEAMESQEAVSFEAYYEPLEEWFEVYAYPSASGLSVSFHSSTERRESQRALERREWVLRELYRVTADKELSFAEKVQQLLQIGREELDTDHGVLSRIEGEDYIVERASTAGGGDGLEAGDVFPLSWTNCEVAVTTEETLVVSDVAENPELANREGNVRMGLDCYLGTPVVVDGEVTGTFCFFDDDGAQEFSEWQVTLVDLMGSWISYERERQARETALTRERDRLDQFASAVSHDLRNPLNVATANLELLREECDSDRIDAVERGLDRMDALIDDVLELARLGEDVVDAEPIRLGDLAREAWGTVSTDGTLEVEGPGAVVGDRTRLRRLLENLFRNSVEHGSTGSRTQSDDAAEHAGPGVTVRIGPLEGGFYVADDGPGIPGAEREQVFDSGYSTAEDGTGFGLAIVREIVEAHRGEIAVAASESGGARFEITGLETRS